MDAFSRFHPVVNFLYFALVLSLSMLIMHPICIGISLVCACIYALYLNGRRALRLIFCVALPLFLFTMLFNPLFNHRGATILWYFPNGNPLTLESILYGAAAGTVFAAVVIWFSCVNRIITSDKVIYLFGRIIPGLSLVLSMILRFVPRFSAQLKTVTQAQKCLGRDIRSGTLLSRVRSGISILSVMVTWTLEDGLDTASSMKSRGYGLDGRGAYTIYRITRRDILTLSVLGLLGGLIITAVLSGAVYFSFYPTLGGHLSWLTLAAYAALCICPVIINIKEDLAWKRIASKT